MGDRNPSTTIRTAPIFRQKHASSTPVNPIPSSSPAFGTPAYPIKPFEPPAPPALSKPSVLPILLPPPTLRPLAFRTFTKKHSLTLTSSALQQLATFIGKHCGAEWREAGLAEKILEEVAKSWKRISSSVIVNGEGNELKSILTTLAGNLVGGRIAQGGLSRQGSFALDYSRDFELKPGVLTREDSQSSLGFSSLGVDDEEEEDTANEIRNWVKVVDAFEQPRLIYNVEKKHFDRDPTKPSLLPSPAHKTQVFRNRFNLIHQRLLRNESFQTPSFEGAKAPSRSISNGTQQFYKITPIANLLGRNGSNHLLLGLLTIAPTGTLAINDLTGSIALDLTHTKPIPEDGAWFAPGMVVLVDGVYEEDYENAGGNLAGAGGVGGTVGGKFIGFTIGGPPCERRQITLGISTSNVDGDIIAGGGFGWVDFLGLGSERALGSKMRRIEQRVLGKPPAEDEGPGRARMVILGEVNLDQPGSLQALTKILGLYATEAEDETPMSFILMGNFVQHAVMARGGSGGSIEYKEYFDSLASALSDYPTLLQTATFIFIPGDNDGWASSFSAGAATPIPRKSVPEMFTSRIKRIFTAANLEAEKENGTKTDGEAIWTTNPSRISLFGPAHEIVLFRDDISSRLRRTSIKFNSSPKPDDGDDIEMAGAATPEPVREPSTILEEMGIDAAVEAAESHIADSQDAVSPDIHSARKLVKTILDQGYLSPFRLATRPVLWDYSSALQLYPLPTAMVLCDAEAPPFCVTYEGCHVMNPGPLVAAGRRGVAKWVEYDVRRNIGKVRDVQF